jgi:hypothetical protein
VIRKFALLILAACGIWLVALDNGLAQPRCSHWYRLSLDPGSRRIVFPFLLNPRVQLQGELIQPSGEPATSGVFQGNGAFTIAIWGDPDSEETSSLEFTTPVGVQIEFISYDGKTKKSVTEGRLYELPAPLMTGVPCPNDPKPGPGIASPSRPRTVMKRTDVPAVKRGEEPETLDELIKKHSKGLEPPDSGKRKSLTDLAQEVTKPPEAIPSPEPPAPKPATPARKDAPSATQLVCGLNFKPIPAADDLKEMQTVGWRNGRKEAEAYDYVAEATAAYPLDAVADVAASASKLVPYEALGRQVIAKKSVPPGSIGRPGDKLLVSVKDGSSLKAKAPHPRPPPPVSVRVIVAGGAPEIVMSGLDAVGAELSKQSGGRAAITVEWYPVTDNGSLGPAQRYDSIEDFIRAADERKGDGRPVPLGEDEIRALLDSLESILVEQTQPVDRVFWIKGAYMVPSAIPARFEQFIEAVTRKSAPVRSSGEWLIVVTARMPGFSIGYLKAPVTSKNVGDVIEEPIVELKPRRFISDPKVLAARLWARANARAAAAPPSEAGSAAPTPNGKVVFDAKDLFMQRGYVLSFEGITAVQQHLRSLWNTLTVAHSSASWKEGVAELGRKTGKPAATILDLLQNGEGRALPRLPKGLPEWSRKDLRELNEADVSEMFKFVTRYLTKIDVTAKEVARQREANETNCSLLYLSEDQLGLH